MYFARNKTDSDLDVLCLELSLELGILDGLLNIDMQGLRPFSQTANILFLAVSMSGSMLCYLSRENLILALNEGRAKGFGNN